MQYQPILVVMAAGMGSRYGGLKQMDPITEQGDWILDFSIFDAIRAGFRKVVFVIKPEMEADFKERVEHKFAPYIEVCYAHQTLRTALPEGFSLPDGRVKPWGTAHAILSAKPLLDQPFAVINADDFYGYQAFCSIYSFLAQLPSEEQVYQYAMVGYRLGNTLTEHGTVARGVCTVDESGCLLTVTERTAIKKTPQGASYFDDTDDIWHDIAPSSLVSMNLWGFSTSFLQELTERFPVVLEKICRENPAKGEFFLPGVVDDLLQHGKAKVQVRVSEDAWYGVTYQEDKASVMQAMLKFKENGVYPMQLWEQCPEA